MKTVMGELTDSTNRAQAFPFMSIVWAIGVTIAYEHLFQVSSSAEATDTVLWLADHCRDLMNISRVSLEGLFGSSIRISSPASSLLALPSSPSSLPLCSLKRCVMDDVYPASHPSYWRKSHSLKTVPKVSTAHATEQSVQCSEDNLVSLRQLLTFPVVLSVSNYTALAFLNITLLAIMPLFFTMPIELGGLGFTPSLIGYILGSCGVLIGLFQVFCFSRIVRYLGERSVFNIGMRAYLIVFTVLPVMGAYAQRFGVTFVVWILIGLVLVMMAFMDMAYGLSPSFFSL